MRISCLNPIIKNDCEILILGTIPGEMSLEQENYYANPKNHFWDFIYRLLIPKWDLFHIIDGSISFEERYNLLLENKIGLWDVLESCEREGSSDKKIKDEIVNDFNSFFKSHKNIKAVIFNGGNAKKYFNKFNIDNLFEEIEFYQVNSTSTLNPNNTFMILNEWKETINNAC